MFADNSPYNNFDLHDQLTDRLYFYDEYLSHTQGGGTLAGYDYAYFAPSYTTPVFIAFPPPSGPFAPVYYTDLTTGTYNGCSIFYPYVGYPYHLIISNVDTTFLRAHWPMETIGSSTVDVVHGIDLDKFGGVVTAAGKIGNAAQFNLNDLGEQFVDHAEFDVGDIRFGFTGWLNISAGGTANLINILERWSAAAGGRSYRLRLVNADQQLRFDVSSNGTAFDSVTHSLILSLNTWYFVACWHDPVANTINLKINNEAIASLAHSTGLTTGFASSFLVGYNIEAGTATFAGKIDELSFWRDGFPTETELALIYNSGFGRSYPFGATGPNMGYPFYYLDSYLYSSCQVTYPGTSIPGYPYGGRTPFYSPFFDYDYIYCGQQRHQLSGCREAVTMLQEIVTAAGRKLIAGTMSRVYELNQSAGNWRVLADGLGNSGYTVNQCGCNSVRGISSTLGGYLLFTNGFDSPSFYFVGDNSDGCAVAALQPITDLLALGITRAGGVIVWKGFVIFYDFTEGGERMGGSVLWGDLDRADSFIESDTSFAGRATVAVGETILNAAPLGNWLMLYTDKSIIRVTLVGGTDVFNFERIYTGGNALKYKFSLIDAGDQHLYLGESDVYAFTQFDTRPLNVAWITKAAAMIFNGITEDDATYEPINQEACNLVTGGWSQEKHEAWMSWPTGDNTCPNVTLRLNLKFGAADFVDHGFSAFLTFRSDNRPSIGQWMEDLGICPRGTQVATGPKDGRVCTGAEVAVANPPQFIRNETENPNLPVQAGSLCSLLTNKTLADYCEDCAVSSTFITASASDFTLKQQEDDRYYREMLGGVYVASDGYLSCDHEIYQHLGYDTVMQQGAENYKNDDEKIKKMVGLEAEPLPQSTPSPLVMEVGYASQPSCFTWKPTKTLDFECLTTHTTTERDAASLRRDATFYFPTWRRGRFLSSRFRISGIGGGGTFSAMQMMVKGWGQQSSP